MDPKVLAGVMNTSTGRCWSSDTYNPCPGVISTAPSSRGYTGGFGTGHSPYFLGYSVK
jgi:3-hydroxyisobutyrate dehydrogenase